MHEATSGTRFPDRRSTERFVEPGSAKFPDRRSTERFVEPGSAKFRTTIQQSGRTTTGITFDGLSNSNKSWHVLQVTGAKTDQTRQRRIARSVDMLRQGRAR